jgi:hypothetical protein
MGSRDWERKDLRQGAKGHSMACRIRGRQSARAQVVLLDPSQIRMEIPQAGRSVCSSGESK